MTEVDDLRRLGEIKHIVVLMMENRSFDHMLGYLRHDGMPDVDGLAGDEFNVDAQGAHYPVHVFPPGQTAFHKPGEPLDESLDPCHDPDCVKEQIAAGKMSGFVKNFIARNKPTPQWCGFPMGYFNAGHLPVYDYLARTFAVCDRWHSSVPGDTWPNRLYSLAGHQADSIAKDIGFFQRLGNAAFWKEIENVPIYDVAAFTRHLDDSQWRWYSHDPASLRAADGTYRDWAILDRGNFAYFDKKEIGFVQSAGEFPFVARDSFLDEAAKGKLRDVSWIDPNFINLRLFDSNSNDDHPPSDVKAGQSLVLDLYHALAESPTWNDTMLVITYDEHGGFYDHVPPPPVPAGDGSRYPTFGVRVPALVIGPRVRQGVCHTFFDHTSLIKTILTRFAHDPAGAVAAMGQRTAQAQHLGVVLEDAPRTDIDAHHELHQTIDEWRSQARTGRAATAQGPAPSPDGAGHPQPLHAFQRGFLAAAAFLHATGLPPGRP